MNRWMRNTLLSASLLGALAVVPGAVAYAHDADHGAGHEKGRHGHGGGLLHAALQLDSLTPEQRAAITELSAQRKTASVPVRQADAQVLTVLARQVEAATIDPQGLAPSLSAEQSAANAEAGIERDTLARLHSILNAAQRGQLVDGILARHASHDGGHEREHARDGDGHRDGFGFGLDLTPEQRARIHAAFAAERQGDGGQGPQGEHVKMLEAFRGDAFDPNAFVVAHNRGERMERLAAAVVPVLTPAQRATFASHLRTRAAHESAPKGA